LQKSIAEKAHPLGEKNTAAPKQGRRGDDEGPGKRKKSRIIQSLEGNLKKEKFWGTLRS